jgi:nucleotide-binding universal stress UspA family protein
MLQAIVIPVDGSALSERAVPYARALARPKGTRLVLVRSVSPASWNPSSRPRHRAELQEARNELTQLAASIREDQHLPIEEEIAQDDPSWAIIDAVERHHADLIVMSTHGRTGLGRWLCGSVAERVLRSAPVPVMLVPSHVEVDWSAAEMLRVLVPLDGSVLAEAILRPLAELTSVIPATVTLVRSVDPGSAIRLGAPEALWHYDPVSELQTARQYLEGCADRLPDAVQVTTRVAEGPTGAVILGCARDLPAHLIAMATHGRTGLARAVLGSVAQEVLHDTRLPLLLVRPALGSERVDAPPHALHDGRVDALS